MKLKYQKSKPFRVNNQFFSMDARYCDWWWCYDLNKWIHNDDIELRENSYGKLYCKYSISSDLYCHSIRAFRRRLKKAPKGVEFMLSSKYYGYDAFGRGK